MRFSLCALGALLTACQAQPDDRLANRVDDLENRTAALEQKVQLPAPMSEEEYRRIPKGTRYLAPDGSTRIK